MISTSRKACVAATATTDACDKPWDGSLPCRLRRASSSLTDGLKTSYAVPDASLTFTALAAPTKNRANVLGVGVHAIDLLSAAGIIESAVDEGRKGYVCTTGVHAVMEAQRDPRFRRILNQALLVTPMARLPFGLDAYRATPR